ncbi:MAG: hypothetical protein AB7G23_17060 [Vicinamibacterales bacterium]
MGIGSFQDVIATLAALAACVVLVRRLVSVLAPARSASACPSCPSGDGACAPAPRRASPAADVYPLTLVRVSRTAPGRSPS